MCTHLESWFVRCASAYVKALVYIGLGKQASFALGVNAEFAIILLV